MVGIPGRSKGCTTCRRRKIKCDLHRPACHNCLRSKKICEGYARHPVFINRTVSGLQTRRPLEEVNHNEFVSECVKNRFTNYHQLEYDSTPLPQQLSAQAVDSAQLVAWYYSTFSERRTPEGSITARGPHWLYSVLTLASSNAILDQTLVSVAFSRRGRLCGDERMLRRGRELYTRALAMLQQALNDPILALEDEILAATSIMAIYELSEPSTDGPVAWMSHISGIAHLIEFRGPRRHYAPMSRSIFEHTRYLLTIRSLIERRGSVFAMDNWRIEPWLGNQKSLEQQIFDHGLMLSGIMEASDRISRIDAQFSDLIEVMQDCLKAFSAIDELRNHYRLQLLDNKNVVIPSMNPPIASQTSASPEITNSVTVTAFQLELSSICNALLKRSFVPQDVSAEHTSVLTGVERLSKMRLGLAHIILGACITRSTRSGSRLVYPLRSALKQFPLETPEHIRCQKVLWEVEGDGLSLTPGANRRKSLHYFFLGEKS